MKKLFVILSMILTSTVWADDKTAEIVENFCYALEASSACENLSMRLGNEQKLEEFIGESIRGNDSQYILNCSKGHRKGFEDPQLCETAWEQFGCYGSVMPGLLQENPFVNKDGVFCEFNPK